MPINKDLSLAPYFDDFDSEKQYYRVLFKPGFAVQARELTQLQTMLQNQVEQFGDNIFKEGSIIKGCNFTNLNGLEFVKLTDTAYLTAEGPSTTLNVENYVSRVITADDGTGNEIEIDEIFELTGSNTGLRADIISAAQGNKLDVPNLRTFFIDYKNTGTNGDTQFALGEPLTITRKRYKRGTTTQLFADEPQQITDLFVWDKVNTPHVGKTFGIQSAPGVIFQKGHFLFATSQTLIVSKYDLLPNNVSVGFRVNEAFVNTLQDSSLYDNANGSLNENAPGADRLRLIPELVVIDTTTASNDPNFFTLVRYQNGNAITVRDVSQYNVLGEELARRTYEESGNYVLDNFSVISDDLVDENGDSHVNVLLGTGCAYVKGYRVENNAERAFKIDQISTTETINAQAVSMDYGNYLEVDNSSGNGWQGKLSVNLTQCDVQDSSGSSLGSALVVNVTPDRVYITNLVMVGSVSEIARLAYSSGYVKVKNRVLEASKKPLVFNTGLRSLFNTSDTLIPVRVEDASATQTGNVITINANADEDFVVDNNDVLVIDSNSNYIPVLSTATDVNNSVLTINLDPSASSDPNVTVYYNKRMIGSVSGIEPYNKVVKEPYIRLDYDLAVDQYNLGFPDVFKITSIVDNAGVDFTNSFRLVPNQKDTHYDLSFMEYIPGRPRPTGRLTIQLKVFQLDNSTGEYFFTINSYPATLDPSDIPAYTSDSGLTYNLRESFDFRPYCNKIGLADYDYNTPGGSPVIDPTTYPVGGAVPFFTNFGAPLIPAINGSVTSDIEYYLSRVDTIVVDSYGEINILKGKEQSYPAPAKVGRDQFAIAQVTIPGYPVLSTRSANAQNKLPYAVTSMAVGATAYTMKDMHSLERKINNMSYYISLNQLEQATENLTILDENGLSRFKNGFVVDPFNDFSLSNIKDPMFSASIPHAQKILQPAVKTFPIDLKFKSSSAATLFPSTTDAKVGTLGRDSNVEIISQEAATGFRNCVSNFYQYTGQGFISPPYDVAYDTTTNPVTIDFDMTEAFTELVENLQEFIPLTDTQTTTRTGNFFADNFDMEASRAARRWIRRPGGTLTDTITTTTREISILPDQGTMSQQFVGDFITNMQFQPFIAARDIKVYMSGLRPNQRHYFYFDKQSIDANVCAGTASDTVDGIERGGEFGAAITSDANGVIRAVFAIPEESFFVGDRVLEIADVDVYSSIEAAATSQGFITYRAYNFSVERTSLTATTRMPEFDVNVTTTTRNVVRRPRGRDPIAQTFFIKKGMGQGSNSVFLSEVDVFFKRVSEENGIQLQIREVVNGYPSNQIIPFSRSYKKAGALTSANVSDDASIATTFAFDAPVRLDVEKEYCVVLQPDANDPNYLVYISQIGQVDLTPGDTQGAAVVQDWGDGVLFSSTNNSAWKSYQDEDLKFVLRRHNFNQSSGSITLTHNDCEFFTIDNLTGGNYSAGELIYQEKALQGGTQATVSVANGTAILTGTALDQTYAVGDFIKVTTSGVTPKTDIFSVVSVDSTTQITLNKPASYAIANGTGTPVVIGHMVYHNRLDRSELYLERSSARVGRTFTAGSPIVGLDSEKSADIVTVDDINLSYIQPMIGKTDDSVSTTNLTGTFVPAGLPNASYSTGLKFSDNNTFGNKGLIVHSKSNDPSGAKSFDFVIDLENNANVTSTPFIDIEISKLFAYQYKVTDTPATTSKYISSQIELSVDLDAEDIHVLVTGYRPTGTDIKVYVRPHNVFDGSNPREIDWVELELFEGVNTYSSNINQRDYREFKYRVAAADKDVDGALTYTSPAGTFSTFRKFAIRIDMLSPNIHNAPTLRDYRAIALT